MPIPFAIGILVMIGLQLLTGRMMIATRKDDPTTFWTVVLGELQSWLG